MDCINRSIIPVNQIKELQKYRFRYDSDKRLLSRSFLYEYVHKNYHINDFELGYNKFKKPFLKKAPEIQFSFSYAKDYAFIGISHMKRIGIDIEHIDEKLEVTKMAPIICCREELAKFNSIDSKTLGQHMYFFQLFSAKESIIKAFGKGLSYDVKKLNTVNSNEFTYYKKRYTYRAINTWQDRYTLAACTEQ